jgi:hypothetical protein
MRRICVLLHIRESGNLLVCVAVLSDRLKKVCIVKPFFTVKMEKFATEDNMLKKQELEFGKQSPSRHAMQMFSKKVRILSQQKLVTHRTVLSARMFCVP